MTNLITKVMHNGTQYDIGGVTSVNGQQGAVTIEPGITKIFTLSGTSDLTTAQDAYDWYKAGGEPIIKLATYGMQYFHLYAIYGTTVRFMGVNHGTYQSTNEFMIMPYLDMTISSDTVTAITSNYNSIKVVSSLPSSPRTDTIYIVQ